MLGYFRELSGVGWPPELARQRTDGEASADFSSSTTSLRKTPTD